MKFTKSICAATLACGGFSMVAGCDDRDSRPSATMNGKAYRQTEGSNVDDRYAKEQNVIPNSPADSARTASEKVPPTAVQSEGTKALQPPAVTSEGMVVPAMPSTQPSTQPVGF